MKKLNYFLISTFLATMLFMNVNVMAQPFTIDVIQPDNTSIDWIIGDTYLISWTDNLTGPVDIYLVNTSLIIDTKLNGAGPVVGSTWPWTISTSRVEDANYQIRVQSSNSSTYKNTGVKFKLSASSPTSTITVLQPSVTGISWARGTSHLISWTDNIGETVDIMASYSGGAFADIETGVSGSTWVWDISPTQTIGSYKIRVESSDFSTIGGESVNTFEITKTEGAISEIYQPEGGEDWAKGTKHLISWNDNLDEDVNLYYTKSGGSEQTILSNVEGSTYVWTTPSTAGTYTIRIASVDDDTEDITSSSFTISETVGEISAIYQPLSTTSWTLGTTHLISWLDNLEEPVDIFYKGISPSVAEKQIGDDIVGSTFSWDMSAAPNAVAAVGTYQIIIKSSIDANEKKESGTFIITASSGSEVTVIQPSVSGVKWLLDSEHYISWDDDFPENVTIVLVEYNAGGTKIDSTVIIDDTPGAAGSTYVWDIDDASYDAGTRYRIKISSIDDPMLRDSSDNLFEIGYSIGTTVEVLQPNGGEEWMQTYTYLICWDDDFAENVKIDLIGYTNAGMGTEVSETAIIASTPGSCYEWEIVTGNFAVGEFYTVRVTSVDSTALTDESDAVFEIVPFGKSPTSNLNLGGGMTNEVVIYPNPTSSQFTISAPESISSIVVRNMLGQIMYNNDVESIKTSIDVSNYEAGIYIVNVIVVGEVITKKLFVQ